MSFANDIAKVRSNTFSNDLTSAIVVPQNNETAAMLIFKTSPEEIKPFSYVKISFVPIILLSY